MCACISVCSSLNSDDKITAFLRHTQEGTRKWLTYQKVGIAQIQGKRATRKMHIFENLFLPPLPDCHLFLLFGGFLFRLWCSPPLCFVDYFLSRSARTIFSFHSRLVVTAAGRVCFLSVSCCRACGVGRLPQRCPLSERTVRPSRPMIFSCIRSSLADRKYRPAREVSMRM